MILILVFCFNFQLLDAWYIETKFPIVWIQCILNTKCIIKLLQVRKILTGNYTQYFVITYMRNLKDNIYIYICVLFTQSCLTLCNPTDYSLPGFSVHEILQARILEWVAISFSNMHTHTHTQLNKKKEICIEKH